MSADPSYCAIGYFHSFKWRSDQISSPLRVMWGKVRSIEIDRTNIFNFCLGQCNGDGGITCWTFAKSAPPCPLHAFSPSSAQWPCKHAQGGRWRLREPEWLEQTHDSRVTKMELSRYMFLEMYRFSPLTLASKSPARTGLVGPTRERISRAHQKARDRSSISRFLMPFRTRQSVACNHNQRATAGGRRDFNQGRGNHWPRKAPRPPYPSL